MPNYSLYNNFVYTKQLDLDLSQQQKNAHDIYNYLTNEYSNNSSTYYGKSTSLFTKYYAYYNYLMMPCLGMTKLFNNIRDTFIDCNNHAYNNNPPDTDYYIQCWLNYYNKGEFIDWHSHLTKEARSWHGFYCVDVEPNSSTYYRHGIDKFEIKSKNNLLVIGKSCDDEHRSSEWTEERPRITVAFDIVPWQNTTGFPGKIKNETGNLHYWIPLI